MHEIDLDGITHGGEAVGRLPDGKACFVPYAIPGERVRVEVVEERKRWARARVVEVVRPSPERVTAPCPYFGQDKCGGCQLQHLAPAAQPALKRRIVTEQLARIGRIVDPPVAETVVVRPFGYRNRARFGVDAQGRLGYRRAQSHDLVPIDRCLLLTDQAQKVRDEAGDGGPARRRSRSGPTTRAAGHWWSSAGAASRSRSPVRTPCTSPWTAAASASRRPASSRRRPKAPRCWRDWCARPRTSAPARRRSTCMRAWACSRRPWPRPARR
jgi:predicted RNA-binding protein with TRAM domain